MQTVPAPRPPKRFSPQSQPTKLPDPRVWIRSDPRLLTLAAPLAAFRAGPLASPVSAPSLFTRPPSAVISSPLALVDNAHHRYNPDIRRQLSPTSPHSYRSQMSAKGKSPGLPPNPRPSSKTTSPMSSAHSTPALDKRFSERPERPERALPPTKEDLV